MFHKPAAREENWLIFKEIKKQRDNWKREAVEAKTDRRYLCKEKAPWARVNSLPFSWPHG
jgi:hypothetical protein